MAGVVAVGSAKIRDVDSLVFGYKWNTLRLTYSFPESNAGFPADYPEAYNNFEALNAAQRAAVQAAFRQISQFTKLTFAKVAGGSGELRFGLTDAVDTALGFLPGGGEESGDSWYNNSSGAYDAPIRGNYAFMTFLHEIGHALGLEHPHEGSPRMSTAHDGIEFTVMSYRGFPGEPLTAGFGGRDFPYTYMTYDIAALQHMYGANFAHNSGNTLYKWESWAGDYVHPLLTIWDGGGIDTYDASDYVSASIDLRPGGWTLLSVHHRPDLGDDYFGKGNIANALLYKGDTRSLIENAIGGPGLDRIRGNQADNRLDGGNNRDTLIGDAGNDIMIGGEGSDFMTGGPGNDTYYMDYFSDTMTEKAGGGMDLAYSSVDCTLPIHLENLTLTGKAVSGIGNSAANTIRGHGGANTLRGEGGNDLLVAGAGSDKLFGGIGNDRLYGEAGADQYCFNTALNAQTNVDRLGGYSSADDVILLDDRIFTALASGALGAAVFRFGRAAADASDRIIYHKSTGRIFYDADGEGGADQILFATVSAGTSLSVADFIVY